MLARKAALISLMLTAAVMSVWVGVAALAQDTPACEGEVLEAAQVLGTAYVRALEAADFEVWGETLADDFEAYYSGGGFIPLDKAEAKGFHDVMIAAAPGLTTTVDSTDVSADCRTVTTHWTSSGLFYGLHGGFQPNGRVAQISGTSVAEIADGMIVREWITYDPIPLPEM
jgi:hypothetical protein